MSRYYGGWAPYVPVAERRRKAELKMAKLRKAGHPVAPVTITGRTIAATFWGKAWCDNMEGYHDYENRLPRGRTYVRNGSVVDLQIASGRVTAMVSGSELYNVTIAIKETPKPQWQAICTDCTGGIDSLVELLQGRFSKGVMERLCRQQGGLFPRPADIRFTCSCPDHAVMCKHVAAVMYGIGARLDEKPELLFRLRAVNEADLVANIDTALPIARHGPAAGRVLDSDDVSALFGLDMAAAVPDATPPAAKSRRSRAAVPAADGVAAAAGGRVAGSATSKRTSAGMRAAKPASANAAGAAAKGTVKRAAANQPSAAVKATPATQRHMKQTTTKTVPVVPKQIAAVAEVADEWRKAPGTPKRAGASGQAMSASVTPVLAVPVRGGGKPQGSKNRAMTNREPKPVKWW